MRSSSLVAVSCVVAALAGSLVEATPAPWRGVGWGPVATIQNPEVTECSGAVPSAHHPNLYWVHNDSGDRPRFFGIDGAGNPRGTYEVRSATHVDWESIAIDDAGQLYLCDVGNNANARQDLAIYVVPEPVPDLDTTVAPLATLHIRYPDQAAFPDPAMNHDCEAVWWHADKLYFLTKHRSDTWTRLYRLGLTSIASGTHTLALVDSLDVESQVTAADLSPDGTELAILCYEALWLVSLPATSECWLTDGTAQRILFEAKQAEAICHEGSTLRIFNEQSEIHRLERAAVLRAQEARAGGYYPCAPPLSITGEHSIPLPLEPAGQPAGPAPQARAVWGDSTLTIELAFAPPVDDDLVLLVSWGEAAPNPLPGAGQHVWEVVASGNGFTASPLLDTPHRPAPAVQLAPSAQPKMVEGALHLPVANARNNKRANLGLNINVFTAGGEWYLGATWEMRGALNPFLWRRLHPQLYPTPAR